MRRIMLLVSMMLAFVLVSLVNQPEASIDDARKAYVPIVATIVDSVSADTIVVLVGSGLIVDENKVVTCYHLYGEKLRLTVLYDDIWYWLKATLVNPERDLVILETETKVFKSKGIRYALHPEVGDRVYAISNMFELNGAYSEGYIMKVTGDFIYISPPLGGGGSGSAVYSNGKVIGIFSRNYIYMGVAVSMVIPVSFLKEGLEGGAQ